MHVAALLKQLDLLAHPGPSDDGIVHTWNHWAGAASQGPPHTYAQSETASCPLEALAVLQY